MGTRGGGVAHRGRLLELDIDTASRGVFEGLFGLVVEAIVPQAVVGRSQGDEMGAREHARPTRPTVRQEDVAAVHAAGDGGWHCVDVEKWGRECVCVCVCVRL